MTLFRRKMKLALILFVLIYLPSCKPPQTVEPSTTKGNINQSAPYLWSSAAFPRTLRISADFSQAEYLNIKSMAEGWETAVENKEDFFTVPVERTPEVSSSSLNLDSIGDDSINGVYKLQNWPLNLSG